MRRTLAASSTVNSGGSRSAIERAFDGQRLGDVDAHEPLLLAILFGQRMLSFLLPPPGDHRRMRNPTRQVDELYQWILGRPEQLEPVCARLREMGISDP